MSQPLWRPTDERIAQANLTAFIKRVQGCRPAVTDFKSLYEWSIDQPEEFWTSVWEFCDVRAERKWHRVIADRVNPTLPVMAKQWFPGATLNFAENLMRFRDDQESLVFWNEQGRQRSLTYRELFDNVSRLAAALRRDGVTVGDRVAAFMPNLPETVIAMLATTSIGAIWSSTSPDFGTEGTLDRFGQIKPKILFAADGYRYAGKEFDSIARVVQISRQIPSIKKTVITSYLGHDRPNNRFEPSISLEDYVATAPGESGPLPFEQLPFDHPIYILYSSGTTGVPKCIVHGAGGTLLQHLKELVLHTDLKRDDRIFYFTTCGWMMWNWLVSSLAVGATVVLYDGSPMHPSPNVLWDMAEQERITVFGTSARYLTAIEKAGVVPAKTHDLSSLRTILSTGSTLAAESFSYVYENIKRDVCLSSISGGTDLVSCFALGNPIGPVYRGELQTRGLGMDVRVFNEQGRPVCGEKGELVCVASFPSMPIRFWNDDDGQKYRAAYFEHFPGVWRHGDWVELTEHDGMTFFGRSDAVLNPGGVRIGTAEIYRQVEKLGEVLESIVTTKQCDDDERLVLFVKLRPNLTLDDSLRDKIRKQIRDNTTPRHVPWKILQVADIPRTRSGKIVELAVRDVIHNRPVKNEHALANPEALQLYKDLPELKTPKG
ncbi:Acetyl-coenzyme A synthetase [Stieleria maiorica]|uniref:Acetyl-coenzyme A synthetase n=1 Tax=Stieleria maiorica TaxID=2795974 RepID=A0A5B9MMD9_9BACT|nr:acetoacetate--CoA ligase [Stieleria maiorica]QEG01580.1 Acetyl-coenzyme A synthetase [Stieleria maiorica]